MRALAMFLDEDHPANAGVVASRAKYAKSTPPILPPDAHANPYWECGSHPDIVERVWHDIGGTLPRDCRCLLHGGPALVHPATGIVLAVCYGTQYTLRLPADAITEAIGRGATTVQHWSNGGSTDITVEFGPDWVFGGWIDDEPAWCRTVYDEFDTSHEPHASSPEEA